jgi:hypothetical protein
MHCRYPLRTLKELGTRGEEDLHFALVTWRVFAWQYLLLGYLTFGQQTLFGINFFLEFSQPDQVI